MTDSQAAARRLEEEFDRRTAEALAYESTWWVENADVAVACDDDPELLVRLADISGRGDVVTTVNAFRGADSWLPKRVTLHERLVNQMLGAGALSAPPAVYFTIGCFGACKSTILRDIVHGHRSATGRGGLPSVIDADTVREGLPEYAGGRGGKVVHDECILVTYESLLPAAQ